MWRRWRGCPLLLYEPDPAAGYRAALSALTELGYSSDQAEQLWSRLGERSLGLDARLLACLALDNSRLDREARYLSYAQAHPEASAQEIVTQVNLDQDLAPYDDARPIDDPSDPLVLVNKYHGLPETYVPELEKLGGRYGVGSMAPRRGGGLPGHGRRRQGGRRQPAQRVRLPVLSDPAGPVQPLCVHRRQGQCRALLRPARLLRAPDRPGPGHQHRQHQRPLREHGGICLAPGQLRQVRLHVALSPGEGVHHRLSLRALALSLCGTGHRPDLHGPGADL